MYRRRQRLLIDGPWPSVNTITSPSIDRTIKVRSSSAYGVLMPRPTLRWPPKGAGEILDYSLDITNRLQDAQDTISWVRVAMSPHNLVPTAASLQAVSIAYGVPNFRQPRQPIIEAVPLVVIAQSGVITTWIAGGAPGRSAQVRIEARTFGGRRFEFLVQMKVAEEWNGREPSPAHAPGFGDPAIWETPRAKFNRPANSAHLFTL